MGRSGTSAITRVLSLCGGSLPKYLLTPNAGNPTGYWEPLDGLHLNEAFLQRRGSNWYDPRPAVQVLSTIDSREGDVFVDEITTFLQDYVERPLLLIKEPRITALTAFWFAAACRMGFQILVVVAVRHPAEVAGSLAARDAVPIELSNTLWLKYNGLPEQRSRQVPRVFVEYPNLLNDWKKEINRIACALKIELHSTRSAEIETFLSPDLRHQRVSVEDDVHENPTAVHRIYTSMSMAARDVAFSGLEVEGLIDAHMASVEAETAFQQFTTRYAPGLSRPFA